MAYSTNPNLPRARALALRLVHLLASAWNRLKTELLQWHETFEVSPRPSLMQELPFRIRAFSYAVFSKLCILLIG
jgi:hypothetical protein